MKHSALKIVLLILLALLAGWFCYRASGQPLPPKIKIVLQSPKGMEQAKSLAKVSVIVLPHNITNRLIWTNPNKFRTGFVIEYRTNLNSAWLRVASVTNAMTFDHVTTTPRGFHRVGAFWP